ncbi:MAG: thioredoxin [Candidatus Omnitrophica bacterium]|jgi:thioredoxin|nr:thioredoxin [Candidatus Omnitrophota bacterium]
MATMLTTENFEQEVLQSDLPVLVDFWAQWCGPCRMLGPTIEELSREYQGKMKVCKLNVDEAGDVAGKYGVMSIPTVILFSKGKVMQQSVGAVPKEKLISLIEPYLKV